MREVILAYVYNIFQYTRAWQSWVNKAHYLSLAHHFFDKITWIESFQIGENQQCIIAHNCVLALLNTPSKAL